jgi:hypothetical protein
LHANSDLTPHIKDEEHSVDAEASIIVKLSRQPPTRKRTDVHNYIGNTVGQFEYYKTSLNIFETLVSVEYILVSR